MENASKAMIIIGSVIVTVLIISAALFVYGRSQGLLVSTGESMSDQEKLSFNQQWTYYDGEQTGDSVKDLLRKMMKNCTINADEQTRLIGLTIDKACENPDPEHPSIHGMEITISLISTTPPANFGDDTTYYSLVLGSDYKQTLKPEDAKKAFSYVRSAIETRHVYNVKPEYSTQGIIDRIIINYELE